MKYFLIIMSFMGLYAYAELPNSVKDKPTDDNMTYLDGKVNSVIKNTKDMFTSSASSKTADGFVTLPNGLIFQWGTTGNLAPNGSVTVTLPKAWPNSLLSITATHKGTAAASSRTDTALFAQATSGNETTQITISKGINGGGAAGTFPVFWQAIGY